MRQLACQLIMPAGRPMCWAVCLVAMASGGARGSSDPAIKMSISASQVVVGDNVSIKVVHDVRGGCTVVSSDPSVASVVPSTTDEVESWMAHTIDPGKVTITANCITSIATAQLRVIRYAVLVPISKVIGWIYFIAWSLSFYPQVIYNFKRKCVVGLNFDYLVYNITGFLGYTVYNVMLFYVPSVQRQYRAKHGDSATNPVQINDVFFAIHAVVLTLLTIGQAAVYDRGGQRVSRFCTVLMGIAWIYILVTLTLASLGQLDLAWLNFIDGLTYIKMGVTLIKYIPQAYMNYSRKSTVGWSIGNVLLDFAGGTFSVLQMGLQCWNNDDPTVFSGDPVKFGLGVVSIAFDMLFMWQHYILYPRVVRQKKLSHTEKSSDALPLLPEHDQTIIQ